ncbi:MAG: methylmalonyl-CoA mutase family protein [Pseudomonadota bacterium]
MHATGFQEAAFERWQALAGKALKGAPLDALQSTTDEGIQLDPLYPPSDAAALPLRGGGTPWVISQRIDHPDPAKAADQLMAELEGGATGLLLSAQGAPGALGYGIKSDALGTLLDGVLVDAVRISFEPGPARIRGARHLASELAASTPPNRSITVDFGLDAPSLLAATGGLRGSPETTQEAQSKHLEELASHGFGGTIYRADGRVVHRAGGTDAQELGFVLASFVFMLKSGGDPSFQAENTLLGVAVDADQFAGVAKLRALRLLHAKLLEAAGLPPTRATIAAETSGRMLTRRDAHVNMLRATTATFAAAIGGADIITALPFSQGLGYPDAFARRTARNTQLVLMSESHLYQVDDPAAGSGLHEAYTQALCEKAWAFFQSIEAQGGVVEALVSGHIQRAVAEAQAARAQEIASGARKLTGSTIYQLQTEYPVEVEAVERSAEPLKDDLATYCEPLPVVPLEPSVSVDEGSA